MAIKNVVVIGSSAGGPRILQQLFHGLPRLNSPILLVQHMPEFINISFCATLDSETEMSVGLAQNDEEIENGKVYVAPSHYHLILENNHKIKLYTGEKVNFVCPAVDVTMLSLQKCSDSNLVGIILTGMGKDGAKGLSHIKKIGGTTIAQDEISSIIYGMPREAFLTGDVDHVMSPPEIHNKLIGICGILE